MRQQSTLSDCYTTMPLGMRTPAEFLKELQSAGAYRFAVHVDGVIVGPCSTGHGVANTGFTHVDGLVDVLLALSDKNRPDWGLEFVGRHTPAEPESVTILLIADCCGQYSEQFLEALAGKYPHVIWLAPAIFDYCHVASPEKIVYDLTAVGMLEPI